MAPLTQRVYFEGNNLVVKDCDGTTVVDEVPCGCDDNPEGGGGEYPPIEGNPSLCDLATYYTVPAFNIMADLQLQMLENYPDTQLGWQQSAAATALQFQLPPYFVVNIPVRMATVPYHDNFLSVNLQTSGGPQTAAIFQTVGCVFYETLIANYGVIDYDILRSKFIAAGMIGFGQMITCIPLATLNEKAFFFGTGVFDSYGYITSVDCEACDDTPPDPGTNCDTCTGTICLKFDPQAYPPGTSVAGYYNIGQFQAAPQAYYWYCVGNDLLLDLGDTYCIEHVRVRNYTPQGAGGTVRSNLVRIEIDGAAVTDFKGQIFGSIANAACDSGDNHSTFLAPPEPKLGRYVKIIGNNGEEAIVQVDVICCTPT